MSVFIFAPSRLLAFRVHGLFRDYVGLTTAACWLLIVMLSIYTELLTPKFNFNRATLKYVFVAPGIIDSNVLLQVSFQR